MIYHSVKLTSIASCSTAEAMKETPARNNPDPNRTKGLRDRKTTCKQSPFSSAQIRTDPFDASNVLKSVGDHLFFGKQNVSLRQQRIESQ